MVPELDANRVSTMNVSPPDELKSYVDEQVGDGSTSEYVRDLIRRDKDRQQLRPRPA